MDNDLLSSAYQELCDKAVKLFEGASNSAGELIARTALINLRDALGDEATDPEAMHEKFGFALYPSELLLSKYRALPTLIQTKLNYGALLLEGLESATTANEVALNLQNFGLYFSTILCDAGQDISELSVLHSLPDHVKLQLQVQPSVPAEEVDGSFLFRSISMCHPIMFVVLGGTGFDVSKVSASLILRIMKHYVEKLKTMPGATADHRLAAKVEYSQTLSTFATYMAKMADEMGLTSEFFQKFKGMGEPDPGQVAAIL